MSANAPDIITYIGVPLAVLGVLPILYNTFATLVALSKIKRLLRHSRLTALTRSDVVNKVIEIELPRYAVTPWDRFTDPYEYWTVSRTPSLLPGGSWTTFNWKTNVIGLKTQRVEYADQLRQPQVEVLFDELVSYLLDLGAQPDPQGWKLLRSTGLWTPAGCALLLSPDKRQKALTIASLDDSDGHLSLAVTWSPHWTTRNATSLPPYWVRLPVPPSENPKDEERKEEKDKKEGPAQASGPATPEEIAKEEDEVGISEDGESTAENIHPASKKTDQTFDRAITCQISVDGIVAAVTQDMEIQSTVNVDSLQIDHIRERSDRLNGAWFASAITAYGTTGQTVLWNYKIPDEIFTFARRETVPCGVLVVLGIVDESLTPQWATHYDTNRENLDIFTRRSREQRSAMERELRMPLAQRAQAEADRRRVESDQRMQDMIDQQRRTRERAEMRDMEALQSPKWDAKLVAEHNMKWLKQRGFVDGSQELKAEVGLLLRQMVLEPEFSVKICKMLDAWKIWADNAGMRKSDWTVLQSDYKTFAQASLLVAMIKDTSSALEGTLSVDLQECLRIWKKVRLG